MKGVAARWRGWTAVACIVGFVGIVGYGTEILMAPAHAADVNERSAKLHAEAKSWVGPTPGTVVLVFVFLAAFILYFFVNWKMLAFVWKVG